MRNQPSSGSQVGPWILVWSLLGLLLSGCSRTASGEHALWTVVDYDGRFEYRYGESPTTAPLAFADPQHDDGSWQPARRIGNQPRRGRESILWLRTRLTGPVLKRPVLSLRLAAHTVDLYIDGQPAALQEAEVGPLGRLTRMRGEYLIPLPTDYAGKTLALRLSSVAPPLGIEAVPRLGESTAVTVDLTCRRADAFLCSLLLMLFALVAGAIFLLYRADRIYLHFSVGCLAFAMSFLGICCMGGLLFPFPLPHYPAHVLGNVIGNIETASFVIILIDKGPWQVLRWFRLLAGSFLAIFIATMALSPERVLHLAVPQRLLALLLFLCLIATVVRGIRRGNADAKLFCWGVLATAIISIPEYLIMANLYQAEMGRMFVPAILAFISTLAVILARRFIGSQSRALRLQIEYKLADRRLQEQEALLLASGRMARGDLDQPIQAEAASPLLPLATALDGMRQDLRSKLQLLDLVQQELRSKVSALETRNQEIGLLNVELRRQIERRSRRLFDMLRPASKSLPAARALTAGELLGEHYRIVRMLGQGGMGTVYEVVRTTDERHLAAKVLRHAVLDKAASGRFAREAQIMASLNHPNLVAISDVDVTADETLYLVMELVEGKSLAQHHERFFNIAWSRAVLAQIAEALAALHSRGIVHRDVKPENVLVSDEGMQPRVKLGDFGIARLTEEVQTPPLSVHDSGLTQSAAPGPQAGASQPDPTALPDPQNLQTDPLAFSADEREQEQAGRVASPLVASKRLQRAARRRTLTQTGVIMGTPGYMAPELLHGASQAQPAADIYSLGVIAVEMFTGKRPTVDRSLLVPNLDDGSASTSLRRECPGLEAGLVDLIERALAVNADVRPTAQALVQALRADAPSHTSTPSL